MTNLVEILPLANTFTDGFLGAAILILAFVGVVLIFDSKTDGVIAASFVAFVLAFPLRYLDLINDWLLWLPAVFLTVAVIAGIAGKGQGA